MTVPAPGARSEGAGYELAMFPLGSVLLPGMALPLRVFEPRYVAMMDRVLRVEPPRFGVVLIERGSEVGGGDVRTDVGCVAEVRAHEDLGGGHLGLLAVGTNRIAVQRWLPDDPYPRAVVNDWPDDAPDEDAASDRSRLEQLSQEVFDLVELAAGLLGGVAPAAPPLSEGVAQRLYELATLAPIGALDRQAVLAAPDVTARLHLLEELVAEQRLLLEARRAFGSG